MPELSLVGFAAIIIRAILTDLSAFASEDSGKEGKKIAVSGVVGFILFGFSDDPQAARVVFAASAFIAVAFFVFMMEGFVL